LSRSQQTRKKPTGSSREGVVRDVRDTQFFPTGINTQRAMRHGIWHIFGIRGIATSEKPSSHPKFLPLPKSFLEHPSRHYLSLAPGLAFSCAHYGVPITKCCFCVVCARRVGVVAGLFPGTCPHATDSDVMAETLQTERSSRRTDVIGENYEH
jgi:hypothetical protein